VWTRNKKKRTEEEDNKGKEARDRFFETAAYCRKIQKCEKEETTLERDSRGMESGVTMGFESQIKVALQTSKTKQPKKKQENRTNHKRTHKPRGERKDKSGPRRRRKRD